MLIGCFTFTAMIIVAAYYSWMSRLNLFFFFGRTVPADFAASPEAKGIVRRYLGKVWGSFAIGVVVGILLWQQHARTFIIWPVLTEAIGFLFAFAQAHAETGRLAPAPEPRTAVEVPLNTPAIRVPSMAALLAPVLVAVVVFAVSLLAAKGNGTLAQSPQALDELLTAHGAESLFSFGAGLVAAGFISLLIRAGARMRTPLAVNALWASMTATCGGTLAMTAAVTITFAGGTISRFESKTATMSVLAAALVLVLYRVVAIRRFAPPAAEKQGDENWLWGLIYFNSSDPALFVQCRCGVGYTLNYGRVMAWPLAAAFVGFLAVMITMAGRH